MKRILIIFLFIIFIGIDNIYAKEIIVDNTKYDDSSDFEGEGYRFRSEYKTIYLDDYNGGSIIYDDSIIIRLKDINTINGDGENGIDVKEIKLYGEGILNIYNSDIGINTEKMQVQNATLYITKCKNGMVLTGNELYLYRTKLAIDDCNLGINSPDKIILVHSMMNIINCEFGIYNDIVKDIFLNESDLYIHTKNYCLYNIDFDDITLSRMVLKSENYCLNLLYDYKNATVSGYVSEDDITYFRNDDYINYPFIKISHKEYIENLLINDQELIIEIDRNFLLKDDESNDDNNENQKDEDDIGDNNDLNVTTKGEYTENEYSKVEIINPQTIDNVYMFMILVFFSILVIVLTLFVRRGNE